jgi:hypothetical protein
LPDPGSRRRHADGDLEALFKSMLHQLMTGQIRLSADEGLPVAADLSAAS